MPKPMRAVYVPPEADEAWVQFAAMAKDAGMSVSALLMLLIRAFIDGRIKLERTTEITTVGPS